MLQKNVASNGCEGRGFAVEFFPHAGEHQAQVVMADSSRNSFPTAVCLLEELALGELLGREVDLAITRLSGIAKIHFTGNLSNGVLLVISTSGVMRSNGGASPMFLTWLCRY